MYSVLEHLIAISDYLISNLDEETGCLKILDGDWNDSLNGLGKSCDQNSKFGTGVSVMATLQLYQALSELSQILIKVGKQALANTYVELRKILGENILKYTIVTDGLNRKILHGWGDKCSYFVGSFQDSDGVSRYSLTSAAFFVLTGALHLDVSLKKDILLMFSKLDAKYGLNTFTPAFTEKSKGVGRIANMIAGTAENGATYNHSTLFGIWALFELGEYRQAWKYVEKVIPITHDKISTSPFIMSNSYIYNPDLGLDGESGGDWYTGSACVLVKVLVYKIFGIECTLDGLVFNPSAYMPFKNATIEMRIRDKKVAVEYTTNEELSQEIIATTNNKTEKIQLNDVGEYRFSFDDIQSDMKLSVINFHEYK